jgi:hypothetical protein
LECGGTSQGLKNFVKSRYHGRYLLREVKTMGRLFEFGCEQGGYRAEVSGGEDAGYLIVTQTMTCLDCKRLVDVVEGESHHGSLVSDIHTFGRCPRFRGRRVIPWHRSRPCPRCAVRMKKLDTRRVCFWD